MPRIWWLWLSLLIALPSASVAAPADPSDRQITRIYTTDVATIRALGTEHDHLFVDRGKGVVVVETDARQRAQLTVRKLRYDADPIATRNFNAPVLAAKAGIPGFACYRTVAETNARLTQLAGMFPTLASVVDIGDSWEKQNLPTGSGEDLRVIKLTNAAIAGPKPVLFITTAIHAREYPTAEVGLRFAEWLLLNYGVDADATWILDYQEVHVLVQTNPDGRKMAQTGLSWRKNTNRGYCSATSTNRGVDLNRNLPWQWNCCGGSSTDVCSDTYHGPAPASDPEAAALDAYQRSVFADQRGPAIGDAAPLETPGVYIDIHNFASEVLWPYGFDGTIAPNGTELQTLGRRLAWYNHYRPMKSSELYPTDGDTIDNAYGQLGVAAYAIELGTTGFFQDCNTFIESIAPDNLAALIYAARVARAPYLLPAGPETAEVRASPPLAFAGDIVRIDTRIDDTRYNQSNGIEPTQAIAGASAYLDTPPWRDTAGAIALAADDGAFDGAVESARANVDTSHLPIGQHTVFVQAREAGNVDGPVGAGFVTVVDPATHGSIRGVVRSATGAPLAATVTANTLSAIADRRTGGYLHRLPPNHYELTFSAPHYEPLSLSDVVVNAGSASDRNVDLYALCNRLSDSADNGTNGWTTEATGGTDTWSIASAIGAFATPFWTASPSGNYANNDDTSLISPSLDLRGGANVQLSFDSVCDTEPGYDFGRVEIRATPADAWAEVFRCSGDSTLKRVMLALPGFSDAPQAQIRFRFTSDTEVVHDGWAVDNIRLDAGDPACRAVQTAGIALNQRGLTGAWSEPGIAGQGFSFEVYPNAVDISAALLFGGWFTYDVAPAGGVERQRWYTVLGNAAQSPRRADLAIYRNVGGNFDAPPETSPAQVGTATIRFDSCTQGEFDYRFDDGSNRSGSMALTRLLPASDCADSGAAAPASADALFSGSWFEPATSGQGLIVEVDPTTPLIFSTWYTYLPNGQALGGPSSQRWYTIQGSYLPGARTMANLPIYQTTGGVFDAGTTTATSRVGTATLQFQSCLRATLAYTFSAGASAGRADVIDLQRVGPIPAGCSF